MATTLVFKIGEKNQAGETKAIWLLDPVWLNAQGGEVPGEKVDNVQFVSADERVQMIADSEKPHDSGKLVVPDTTLFTDGEQIPVNIIGTDEGNVISLDAVLVAEGDTTVTHGELSATKEA